MALINLFKKRAAQQSQWNIETLNGTVQSTYTDSQGNVVGADVLVEGQVNQIVAVPNASGIKLWAGAKVKVNNTKGVRTKPEVIGVSGGGASTTVQMGGGANEVLAPADPDPTGALAGQNILLASDNDAIPDGFVLTAGAGITLTSGTDSFDGNAFNTLTIDASASAIEIKGASGDQTGVSILNLQDMAIASGGAGQANAQSLMQPAWGLRGLDADDGGVTAFDPSDITPTWATYWLSANGNLNFASTTARPVAPIGYQQQVILSTRLKVDTATTIEIAVYADNHCRVILNGSTVGSDASDTNSFPLGTMTYSLSLNAGWNDLVLCYGNGDGESYALAVAGWASGASTPLASLVDCMAGTLPA